jgi:hypothetical protein
MNHELKIIPQVFARFLDGSKTFEVVPNDGYQMGDTVTLREWDPTPVNPTDSTVPRGYTQSKPLEFRIGYVHVLSSSEVIFSLLPMMNDTTKKTRARTIST